MACIVWDTTLTSGTSTWPARRCSTTSRASTNSGSRAAPLPRALRDVQLSPKGQLVDRFPAPDRPGAGPRPAVHARGLPGRLCPWLGAVALLAQLVQKHHNHSDRFRFGDHEAMLQEYFSTAFYPIGPESTKPMTGTNEVYVPGVFGDIFDVIFAYPDVKKWRTIDTYPVVVAAGDIELTQAEGERLAQYVDEGGTLLVADTHLTGPGLAALSCRGRRPGRGDGYRWLATRRSIRHSASATGPSPAARRWQPRPTGKSSARRLDRGKGRLIYLAVPRGLGIDRQAQPVVARLLAHLTRGLMPVEVEATSMAGQPHDHRLGGDPAQPRRPAQTPARHHAHRYPREPHVNDQGIRANQVSPRPAPAGRQAGGEGRQRKLRSDRRRCPCHRVTLRSRKARLAFSVH